jgi:hypothetical protein
MPYRHKDWVLYKKDVMLRCNKVQTIYFFSKHTPRSGTPCDLPEGYKVIESERTGLPLLKKIDICK